MEWVGVSESDEPTTEDVAAVVAEHQALLQALAVLPPRQRACLVLRYLDGDPPPVEWWSASPTESGPARLEEAATPGVGSGHGRLLSRIDPTGQLVVRDLLDGSEWSAPLRSRCTNGWVTTTENRVLVSQSCPDGAQFVAFDGEGNRF